MSLSDFYETASPLKHTPCKVCIWYATIEDDAKAFFDAKINVRGEGEKLWRACRAFDPDADFSVTTVRRHRLICLSCR